jgi:IS5 family transposase
MLAERVEALLADKGYDAGAIRDALANAGVEAVIPAKSNRRTPIPHDRQKYPLAQSHRAPVQQTQELAARRHPVRQNNRILPRLHHPRLS